MAYQDAAYLDALVRMFEQALRTTTDLSVFSQEPVVGLTHNFYRYPARFSPLFTRAAIEAFTAKNELVFDPFMGGGTTLVEAFCAGSKSCGNGHE